MLHSSLYLEDGSVFSGFSPSWQKDTYYGEVVFTTGLTGYVETLTDPSYKGQIVVFTYPLIGNYGVPDKSGWESNKIQAAGAVVSEFCAHPSHNDMKQTLANWLNKEKAPFIAGIDTRALTKQLREHGVMRGCISCHSEESINFNFSLASVLNPVSLVTCPKKTAYGRGQKKIIAVDCGMKKNILRSLKKYPLTINVVPYDYDYTDEEWDGLFISNGPGDPENCKDTIRVLKKALDKKKPIFGICLGSQLLALASGASTYKLPFGHRGQNQPCQDTKTSQCYITSQNHGYAVKAAAIPKNWHVSFRNLNDGSVEGYAHDKLPFFSVQFHPEAAPGPLDTFWLFEKFYKLL